MSWAKCEPKKTFLVRDNYQRTRSTASILSGLWRIFHSRAARSSTLPEFVPALAMIKEAAARANQEIGALSAQKADAIIEASQEIRAGTTLP
ncbi:hypothetical protein QA640_36025 [Bradyrhizobium sp. CB82]|uniref:hypothetical protein n=1 Tax=Bradyrhizobium sp. CB82 TaxID=3039159 RepID=UPI0024B0D829|nr:hypothetical protein [Bradyrhizobium sp. CB82]WFU39710.1 hypothetical protein QA640_36025 [Bradyrhizobium sp. CB82]